MWENESSGHKINGRVWENGSGLKNDNKENGCMREMDTVNKILGIKCCKSMENGVYMGEQVLITGGRYSGGSKRNV